MSTANEKGTTCCVVARTNKTILHHFFSFAKAMFEEKQHTHEQECSHYSRGKTPRLTVFGAVPPRKERPLCRVYVGDGERARWGGHGGSHDPNRAVRQKGQLRRLETKPSSVRDTVQQPGETRKPLLCDTFNHPMLVQSHRHLAACG